MNLLLDLGNTRLKWLIERQGALGQVMALDYRRPDFLADLQQHWQSIDAPQRVAIASVSDRAVLNELILLSQRLWPDARLIMPKAALQAFGVKNAYVEPEKLGVDRWLALLAAHRQYPGNVWVIDCGTAITLDALQADGSHLGGMISPGLTLMKQALATSTADLRFTERRQSGLATATEAAIASGTLMAATGLIEQARRQLDASYRLILTGGDAPYIAQSLPKPWLLDHDLVLKGLSIVCQGEPNS